MMKKDNKPLNISINLVTEKDGQKSLGHYCQYVMQCLVIIVAYIPLVLYVMHLHRLYPHDTSLLSLETFQLFSVIILIVAPLFILPLIGVNWRNNTNENETY